MGSYTALEVAVDDDVGRITLARPEALNALTPTMLEEIVAACAEVADARVVLLNGAGRAFTGGADIASFDVADTQGVREAALAGEAAAAALESLRGVTVAAVHGWCVGGGVVLASACDLRLASTDATFRIPETAIGIPLAWGGVPRLLRDVPPAVVRDLVLSCRTFSAQEAQRIGLVSRVVDDVAAEVEDLSRALVSRARVLVDATLDAVRSASAGGEHDPERDMQALLAAIEDPEAAAVRHAAAAR